MRPFIALVSLCFLAVACDSPPDPRRTDFKVERGGVKAEYNPKTGRLTRLEVDTNKNGKIDAWTYQEGTRLDRIELDKDENGKIDRWEHYVDNKMVKIGTSSRGDGVEDEWAYPNAAAGFVERVESDTNRDGRVDKWESFEASPTPGGRAFLRSVSMDPDSSGRPTRRLLYRADGSFDRSETLNNSAK
jgi:hypothetical protein